MELVKVMEMGTTSATDTKDTTDTICRRLRCAT
jgi:hypothetical protein